MHTNFTLYARITPGCLSEMRQMLPEKIRVSSFSDRLSTNSTHIVCPLIVCENHVTMFCRAGMLSIEDFYVHNCLTDKSSVDCSVWRVNKKNIFYIKNKNPLSGQCFKRFSCSSHHRY